MSGDYHVAVVYKLLMPVINTEGNPCGAEEEDASSVTENNLFERFVLHQ